jgi:hypothetical protein
MNYALQNFTELFWKSYDSLEKKFSQRKSIEMLYNLLK